MPTYTVRDPNTGETVSITQDSPPTGRQIRSAFAAQRRGTPQNSTGVDFGTVGNPQSAMAQASTPWTRESVADVLPMVGGSIGGRYGSIGAGVGGAAGRGYAEVVRHADEILPALRDVVQNIRGVDPGVRNATLTGMSEGMGEGAINAATSGAIQASLHKGSELATRGLRSAAEWSMDNALKPGWRVVRDRLGNVVTTKKAPIIFGDRAVMTRSGSLASQNPDFNISSQALDRGVGVWNRGAASVGGSAQRATERVNQAISEATRRGVRVNLNEVFKGLADDFDEFVRGAGRNSPDAAAYLQHIDDALRNLTEYRGGIPPVDLAQAKKRFYQDIGERYLRDMEGPLKARVAETVRRGLRPAIEEAVDPGRPVGQLPLGELNFESRVWSAIREALTDALDREAVSSRYTLAGLIDNPRLWGGIAQTLNLGSRNARHIPNALRAILIKSIIDDSVDNIGAGDRANIGAGVQGGPGPVGQ